jgi:hypothetical protein
MIMIASRTISKIRKYKVSIKERGYIKTPVELDKIIERHNSTGLLIYLHSFIDTLYKLNV